MKFIPAKLSGVFIIVPDVFKDKRGFFLESYRKDAFLKQGIRHDFVQDNHSFSRKGTLRGLHYQVGPKAQAKLVRVVHGEVFDALVDVRRGSRTFGKHMTVRLSGENKKMLYVPAGIAHGFLTLSKTADVLYKVSAFYSSKHEHSLLWNDPQIGIQWPVRRPILSDKDKSAPILKDLK